MNFKKLKERKAELQAALKKLLSTAESENRALTDEDTAKFDEYEKEIKSIDNTLAMEKRAASLMEPDEGIDADGKDDQEQRTVETEKAEERAFINYIRGEKVEERADAALTMSANGAVIPTSIANKIIEKIVDICPVFKDAEHYDVSGTLEIPYYDEDTSDIETGYADEGTDGNATKGDFKNISLTGFLGRAISVINKSLINNSKFDVLGFVVRRMSQSMSRWVEKELLVGTDNKIAGLSGIKQIITAKSATSITADELIDLQEEVPDAYQADAYWIMNKKTRTAIRKLKDGQGNYLLNRDATARWGYTLLGKDVYCSDNMPKMEAGKRTIIYGDMKGLAVKVSEQMNIEVLRETRARKHQLEVIGFIELDSKVQNTQMLAALEQAAE